ncbi:hypothetical protein PG985_012750 [Apiospora marii]|uniref:uncharacterized protein n=1 Tax=Apiospora marii TaxID=335849 RepID=UPI00312E84B5
MQYLSLVIQIFLILLGLVILKLVLFAKRNAPFVSNRPVALCGLNVGLTSVVLCMPSIDTERIRRIWSVCPRIDGARLRMSLSLSLAGGLLLASLLLLCLGTFGASSSVLVNVLRGRDIVTVTLRLMDGGLVSSPRLSGDSTSGRGRARLPSGTDGRDVLTVV